MPTLEAEAAADAEQFELGALPLAQRPARCSCSLHQEGPAGEAAQLQAGAATRMLEHLAAGGHNAWAGRRERCPGQLALAGSLSSLMVLAAWAECSIPGPQFVLFSLQLS